jgi:hypothetical protein
MALVGHRQPHRPAPAQYPVALDARKPPLGAEPSSAASSGPLRPGFAASPSSNARAAISAARRESRISEASAGKRTRA